MSLKRSFIVLSLLALGTVAQAGGRCCAPAPVARWHYTYSNGCCVSQQRVSTQSYYVNACGQVVCCGSNVNTTPAPAPAQPAPAPAQPAPEKAPAPPQTKVNGKNGLLFSAPQRTDAGEFEGVKLYDAPTRRAR